MITHIWIAALIFLNQFIVPEHLEKHLEMVHKEKIIDRPTRSQFVLPVTGPPLVDNDRLNAYMDHLNSLVVSPAVNAKINASGGITPGRSGHRLYRRMFKDQFYASFYSGGTQPVHVPLIAVQPKVDSELLGQIRVQAIGRYATFFNPGNKSRANNITLALKAINNHVVFPGEIFSFNHVVGRRTKAKGYRTAKVIVRGEYSEGIGGGICQVSSTLFNAADRAGLHIVQRFSHSKHVSYVPPGRDATVSWYGPDFQFQNNYHQPILIRAHSSGSHLSFTLYSSDVINFKPKHVPAPAKKLPRQHEHR
ncbi:VanW family protein [Terrilactibacillus sp. S3-3]|nr:VanW family protein [Terrilactibacillus sp. S3-3]